LYSGNNTVVVILKILAAIAIPNYIGQQEKAKDAAAMAQLCMAATSQQLYYVDQNACAGNVKDLKAYGFRQGEQMVTVGVADASTYCMQPPGGGGTFMITQDTDTSLGFTRKTLSLPGLQVATGSVRVCKGNGRHHGPGFSAPRVLDPIITQEERQSL
jgi:type IV pilus assembly protein PilA